MRVCFLFIFYTMLLMSFSSCWKGDTPSVIYVGGTGTQLVRIQQGTDPATDTVFKILYNGNNISQIYDSIFAGSLDYSDGLNVFYNGNLLQTVSDFNGKLSATYTYDSAERLKEVDIIITPIRAIIFHKRNGSAISAKAPRRYYTRRQTIPYQMAISLKQKHTIRLIHLSQMLPLTITASHIRPFSGN
jgi:hypothetical protein